jgi:hypothetical protein
VVTRQSKCEKKEKGEANKKVKEVLLAVGINSSSPSLFLLQGFMGNYAKTTTPPSAFFAGLMGC